MAAALLADVREQGVPVPQVGRAVGRHLVPVAALVALLVGMVTVVVTASSGTATTGRGGPSSASDRGRFTFFTNSVGGPYPGVVHAVRRATGATVLYFSVGTAEAPAGGTATGDAFLGFGTELSSTSSQNSLRLARLVDVRGGKVYRALTTSPTADCLCTPLQEGVPSFDPTTELVTFGVVFPELPASVTTVDVDVNGMGALVTGVPVEPAGPLTPAAGGGSAVVMGQGWPELDLSRVSAIADQSPFVTDLVASTSDLEGTVRKTSTTGREEVDIAADVLFAVDKADLSSAAQAKLRAVAEDVSTRAAGVATIVGYTDSTGSATYNVDLSRRRAVSVQKALEKLVDAPGVTFTSQGKGQADPVGDNATTEGRALNRRVTVSFQVKGAGQ